MIIKRRTNAAQLRAELDQFEAQFGVPSQCLVEAFTVDEELQEGPAFARWTLVDAAYLGFDKFVDADLTVVEYHDRYAATDGRLLVELHNHRGHERDVGSCWRITDGDDRRVGAADRLGRAVRDVGRHAG